MPKTYWKPIIIALGIIAGVLFIVFILIGFACLKSKQRTEKRLDRRNSLRASLRASKQSILSTSKMNKTISTHSVPAMGHTPVPTSTMGSTKKRKRPHLSSRAEGGFLDLSGITLGESTTDSFDKLPIESRRPSTPHFELDRSYSNPKLKESSSSYLDSDLQDFGPVNPHRMENEIPHISARPMMDSLARGAYGDERSLDRSYHPDTSYSKPSYNKPSYNKPSYNRPRRPPLDDNAQRDYLYSKPMKKQTFDDDDDLSMASSYQGSRYNYNNSGYYEDPLGEPSRPGTGRGTKPPRPALPQDRLDRSTSSEFDSRPRPRPKESAM